MGIAGIDAMILVYAGIVPSKNTDSPTAELHVRAKRLFDKFSREETTIILPTIAISEILIPVPPSETGLLIQALSEQFVCPTFDLQSATIAANIWATHKKLPRDQQYKNRHILKADAMIIASAHAAGATVFYSNDAECRRLASIVMTAEGLPDKPEVLEDLFIESDIRAGQQPPPIKKKRKSPKRQ